ncbi:MAG: hypothetical protein ACO3A2_10155 [Bdellovibrionia bacterium]
MENLTSAGGSGSIELESRVQEVLSHLGLSLRDYSVDVIDSAVSLKNEITPHFLAVLEGSDLKSRKVQIYRAII